MSTRPRIRSIKPEMGQDEKFGQISRDGRLLFLGLISLADDEGRFRALPNVILGHWYPYDPDAPRKLNGWLDELSGIGMVTLYSVDGIPYGWLPGWHHQRINRKTPSLLPSPPFSRSAHEHVTEDSVNGHGVVTEFSRSAA